MISATFLTVHQLECLSIESHDVENPDDLGGGDSPHRWWVPSAPRRATSSVEPTRSVKSRVTISAPVSAR
jgi:hypothetical protein